MALCNEQKSLTPMACVRQQEVEKHSLSQLNQFLRLQMYRTKSIEEQGSIVAKHYAANARFVDPLMDVGTPTLPVSSSNSVAGY